MRSAPDTGMTALKKALRWTRHIELLAIARGIVEGRPNIAGWIGRRAQRRALAALDDRLLRDIGKTRAEAMAEARKPFWRA
ncbi:DUF1127 domain-containing protein [Virgifigura deserti]|uniref:DUF1127 domain-containing protein n=1 Tax=Virgifigura deserti TaxID=2268457 RepID=UPI003CCC0120